jgi:hypothetical protein
MHGKMSGMCPLKPRNVFAVNDYAVVYESKGPDETVVKACAYRSRHAYALGPTPYASAANFGGVFHETLAGTTIAYEFNVGGGDGVGEGSSRNWVGVRDLRTGKVLHYAPTGVANALSNPGNVGTGKVWGLVVKGDGAVAWISYSGEELGGYDVHVIDRTGSRVLAAGLGVQRSSLALGGSRLYWTQNGVPESAVLH